MKDHKDKLEKGDIFKLPAQLAHPTQFAVGMVSVDCKRRQVEQLHESGKLDQFLCQEGHLAPVVIGPQGVFYLTDHHHLCSSLWRADIPDKEKNLVAYVLHDWSDQEPNEFWRQMIEGNLTWLYDEKGTGPLNPLILPCNIGTILNDPYRTLSRWLRDCGCYTKDELKDKTKSMGDQEKFFPQDMPRRFSSSSAGPISCGTTCVWTSNATTSPKPARPCPTPASICNTKRRPSNRRSTSWSI